MNDGRNELFFEIQELDRKRIAYFGRTGKTHVWKNKSFINFWKGNKNSCFYSKSTNKTRINML